MIFTQNDWGQHANINKIIILTKGGKYAIHAVIPTKYQKNPSKTILKHANILAKVNKSPYVCLLNMFPHYAYSIKTHVHIIIMSVISH